MVTGASSRLGPQIAQVVAELDDAPQFARIAARLGYRCHHESSEAANYLRGDERLDALLASRTIARGLLDELLAAT